MSIFIKFAQKMKDILSLSHITTAAIALCLVACTDTGAENARHSDVTAAESLRHQSDSLVDAARHISPTQYREYFGRALELRREASRLAPDTTDSDAIKYLESRMRMIDTLYYYQSRL